MSSCEKKLNGYVNLKRTVGYQSTKIGKFACYILACLSSCLITEMAGWLTQWYQVVYRTHSLSVWLTVCSCCLSLWLIPISWKTETLRSLYIVFQLHPLSLIVNWYINKGGVKYPSSNTCQDSWVWKAWYCNRRTTKVLKSQVQSQLESTFLLN